MEMERAKFGQSKDTMNKKGISLSLANPLNIHGAGGRNRTDMSLRLAGF